MTTNAELAKLVESLTKAVDETNKTVGELVTTVEEIQAKPDPSSEVGDTEIAKLQGQIDSLAKVVAGKKRKKISKDDPSSVITREDNPGENGGWVVEARNKAYSGMTCGVQFTGGLAIVDVAFPDSEKVVHKLEHEFEYAVTALDEQELNDARREIAMGNNPFGQKEKELTVGEKLLKPVSFVQ
jgi:hypothetical protein